MNLFEEAKKALDATTPEAKTEQVHQLFADYQAGRCTTDMPILIRPLTAPSYAPFLEIVSLRDLPKRKSLHSEEGMAQMLHAVVHIEYSAIDLALDAIYRYPGLDQAYYDDWMTVAKEEAEHFVMLRTLLEQLGVEYGTYPVHDQLFSAMRKTEGLLERMAVVPRFLEASGLDSNPVIMQKLQGVQGKLAKETTRALEVILQDEVGHVQRGDRWFRYACERESRDPDCYFSIVRRYFPHWQGKQQINLTARREAGFSEEELRRLAAGDF